MNKKLISIFILSILAISGGISIYGLQNYKITTEQEFKDEITLFISKITLWFTFESITYHLEPQGIKITTADLLSNLLFFESFTWFILDNRYVFISVTAVMHAAILDFNLTYIEPEFQNKEQYNNTLSFLEFDNKIKVDLYLELNEILLQNHIKKPFWYDWM